MNPRTVAKHAGGLFLIVAVLLLVPTGLADFDGVRAAITGYGVSAAITFLSALVLLRYGRTAPKVLHRKDALGIVALTWIGLGVFGAMPFLIEGSITNVPAAIFEAVSGFTTTGATVVADVDGLSRATNLWRCLMHWIGGMGIVVLFVAVLPQLGVGAKHLFRTEVAGPITEGLRPKITQTAITLWWVYAGLTLLCAGALFLAGMNVYDAVCHAFSTLGTGGFSTKGSSIGAYQSATIDWIIIGFMMVAGLNFALFYGAMRGKVSEIWRNYEVRFYVFVNVAVAVTIYLLIRGTHTGEHDAFRAATFQTLAVTTTTGFMTEDFDAYPNVARFLLFGCMFMGGCAGSTAGGLKASRIYAMLKMGWRELRATLQPQAVMAIRLGNTAVPDDVLRGIAVYFGVYLSLFGAVSLVMVALGLDLVSAMTSVIACLSSVGPGLADVGPTQNFDFIPGVGKILLSLCMIAGRLEIFPLLAVLSPEAWRR